MRNSCHKASVSSMFLVFIANKTFFGQGKGGIGFCFVILKKKT